MNCCGGSTRRSARWTDRQAWPGCRPICDSVAERAPLVRTLALAACKLGNDPHNQEIPQNMLEDFGKNQSPRRDRLLLACAQHCAAHRKYGDPFEAAQRFARSMGLELG